MAEAPCSRFQSLDSLHSSHHLSMDLGASTWRLPASTLLVISAWAQIWHVSTTDLRFPYPCNDGVGQHDLRGTFHPRTMKSLPSKDHSNHCGIFFLHLWGLHGGMCGREVIHSFTHYLTHSLNKPFKAPSIGKAGSLLLNNEPGMTHPQNLPPELCWNLPLAV